MGILFNKKDLERTSLSPAKRSNLVAMLRKHCGSIEKMTKIVNKRGKVVSLPMYHFDIDEAVAFISDYLRQDNRGYIKKSRMEIYIELLNLREILYGNKQAAA